MIHQAVAGELLGSCKPAKRSESSFLSTRANSCTVLFRHFALSGSLWYTNPMSAFELAVAKLKGLPASSQVEVVDYIDQLHAATRKERLEALQRTAGCFTKEEALALEKAIEESYEKFDE